jgi:Ca-activated chloride channel family protein
MDPNLPLAVRATFDRKSASINGDSAHFLVVTVTAPTNDFGPRTGPRNLGIVIDASDSMSGVPLNAARTAAIGVVNSLNEHDLLSLISFADDRKVHFEKLAMNKSGKHKAVREIENVRVHGNTNLSGGWLAGAGCVAAAMEQHAGFQNHVLLLSDGYANLGITDPGELRKHAMELQMRGIISSTVGIGDGYSPAQLRAVAEHGGGKMHDAQYPGEIIEVVLGHLEELCNTSVEAVKFELEFPELQTIENISGFPSRLVGNKIEILCGSLLSSANRSCVFRIRTAPGKENEKLVFNVRTQYQPVGMPISVDGDSTTAELTYRDAQQCEHQSREIAISRQAAITWQACIVSRVVEMNRQNQFKMAVDYIDRQLEKFIEYCDDLESCDNLVNELLAVRQVASIRWDERSRKEMQLATYQTTYNHIDTRHIKRDHWSTFLPKSNP